MDVFFHYCQSIFRKVREVGLYSPYKNIENSKLLIKFIMSLALLPVSEVKNSFLALEKFYINYNNQLSEFFKYFKRTWLSNLETWNVFIKEIRTNNDIKAWHFAMSRNLNKHPDIFTFLIFLQQGEFLCRLSISQSDSGRTIKRANRNCNPPWKNFKINFRVWTGTS